MGPKKAKKILTEEEKKAKAEYAALLAYETRNKKTRDRRVAIKQAMIEEEKRSKLSMVQMHKEWRNVMRQQSVQEQRSDIKWLAEKFIHEVGYKDRYISILRETLKEAEDQHEKTMSRHFVMLDNMIDVHDLRMKDIEDEFQENLGKLNQSFYNERDLMTQNHDGMKKDLATMVARMKAHFDEETDEKRQEFEFHYEEVKSKNKDEYNVLKYTMEALIEQKERVIEKSHMDYLDNTRSKEQAFNNLTAKDKMTSNIIEKRMRELIKLHNKLAYTRTSLITKGKEWDASNTVLRQEKGLLLKHYSDLKNFLTKVHDSEHKKLKQISKQVGDATEVLNKHLMQIYRLQTLSSRNTKLETEHEQVFPFNPLYIASVPTAPLDVLDEEMVTLADDENCDIHGHLPKRAWEVADDVIQGEPLPDQVEPKADVRFEVEMRIPVPSDSPIEEARLGKAATYHWSSHAVDDNGNEVAELDYFQNFQKRYNKVMLDKLAIELEKRKLEAENMKLQKVVSGCLDGYTINEQAKMKYKLMLVDQCKMAPPLPRRSTIEVNLPKKKPPPERE